MMDGWKSSQYQHGMRAFCRSRDGVAVACKVTPYDGAQLLVWLRTRPDLCLLLWDEMDDERAFCNTCIDSIDGPQTKGNIAATMEKDGGNV